MADTTERLRLHRPTGGDPAEVPADLATLTDQLDELVLGYNQGPIGSRPDAGVEGRMYYATDDGALYYDMGAGWVPAAFQPGMIQWTATNQEPPVGWLPADGRPYSRTIYRALFGRISTVFGAGDGTTTFNVPDLRGRAPIGAGLPTPVGAVPPDTGLTMRSLAARPGVERHQLTTAEMPAHSHTVYDPGHNHGGGTHNSAADRPYPAWGSWFEGEANSTYGNAGYMGVRNFGGNTNGMHAHAIPLGGTGISLYNSGSGGTHNNVQPSLVLNAWIKT